MKAALYHEKAKALKIESVPDPKVPQGWALIRVRAAGVCGTELHFLDGILGPGKTPFILGHEIAGEVVEAPKGSNWKIGDRVCIYNKMNCGKCRNCRNGSDELCSNPVGQIGFSHDGGFAEYVVAPESSLVSLPQELSFVDGAVLSCGGISARHAVRLAEIGILDTVVVDGVGGVGLMVAQVAKLAGARVLAIADSDKKAELMKRVGIEESIVIEGYEGLAKKILAKTEGKGVDAFFELVGTRDSTREGLLSLADLGRFVIIGYTKDRIDVDPLWMVIGERKLLSSVQGAKRDLEDVLELARRGKINTVVQNQFPIEKVNDALQAIRERKSLGRNVIVF
jgi:2-desacetyl-2-hydroxyethyl bacteriochlorophyllide A dehydrogenase